MQRTEAGSRALPDPRPGGPEGAGPDGRLTLDEYFMRMAHLVKQRGTCRRRQVGAVVVRDKMVVSTGYNGAPRGVPHCSSETGCLTDDEAISQGARASVCMAAHAEINAIVQAGYNNVSVKGGTLYCTTFPCNFCSKAIINAGVREIVYEEGYPDDLSRRILSHTSVVLRRFSVGGSDLEAAGGAGTGEAP
ncbi:MAG TPA: dCMP deaminase family protein [Candidatus Thermoplasmatota archaeon]